MLHDLPWILAIYLFVLLLFVLWPRTRRRGLLSSLFRLGIGLGASLVLLIVFFILFWIIPSSLREDIEQVLFLSWREHRLVIDFDQRHADIIIPNTKAPDQGYPLLLVLHGYGNNKFETTWYMGLQPMADRYNLLLLIPNGSLEPWGRRFWNATEVCCDARQAGVDDAGYLFSLLDKAKAEYPVDPNRVYILGHSNGGYMAYRLACERPELFQGIVSLAGAGSGREAQCSKAKALSVLQVHGERDGVVRYDGSDRDSPSALKTAELWAQHMECAEPPAMGKAEYDLAVFSKGNDTDSQTWKNCREGHSVALWTVNGAGHMPLLTEDFFPKVWSFLSESKAH